MRANKVLVSLVFLGFLAACGDPSKQEIIQKTENASTKAQLEEVLGKPASIDKVGPVEKWTYKASDGKVTFLITAGRVALSATGSGDN